MAVGEKIKELWHDWIPAWFPIFMAILGGAFVLGQQQQKIMDRLDAVEKQVQHVQDYLYSHPQKSLADPLLPGVSSNQMPQDAGNGIHYTATLR